MKKTIPLIALLLAFCQFLHAQCGTGKDVTPPVFTCPAPQVLSLTAGCDVVIPDHITGLTAIDCSAVTFEQFPAAGVHVPSQHGVGQAVLIRATDAAGNVTECYVPNATKDVTPPTISCGGDAVFYINSRYECAQFALFDIPTYTDNCPGSTLETTLPRGNYLPPGIYTSTYTVTDPGGNKASCSFKVTIIDNFVPEITCPYTTTQTRAVNAGSCSYLVHGFEFDATAYDNCGYTLTYSLSGATTGTGSSLAGIPLNKGTTKITWTARDAQGNSSSCSFDVVVGTSLDVTIPDAFAYSMGATANTIYYGFDPASILSYTATVSGGNPPYSYSWTADPAISFVGSSTSSTVQVSSSTAGSYLLTLTITDGNGCQKAVSKTIFVVDVRSGTAMSKITVCQFPPGNQNSPVTVTVSPNAVSNLLGNGAILGPCPATASRPVVVMENPVTGKLSVSLMPNPSSGHFNLFVTGGDQTGKVSLRIINITGQLVEVRNSVPLDTRLQVGGNFRPGTYVAELIQGDVKTRVLLVKQ